MNPLLGPNPVFYSHYLSFSYVFTQLFWTTMLWLALIVGGIGLFVFLVNRLTSDD